MSLIIHHINKLNPKTLILKFAGPINRNTRLSRFTHYLIIYFVNSDEGSIK